jgi:hypothetical protein
MGQTAKAAFTASQAGAGPVSPVQVGVIKIQKGLTRVEASARPQRTVK